MNKVFAISALVVFILSGAVSAAPVRTQTLISTRISTTAKKAHTPIAISGSKVKSARLQVTAYNSDDQRRHTVYLDIDKIGGEIAYGVASSIPAGYVGPKQTKTWTIDLGVDYKMIVRSAPKYEVVLDSDKMKVVNYLDILRKPGKHTLNCWVSSSDKRASKSTVSVKLITIAGTPQPAPKSKSLSISAERTDDLRMQLALAKLRDAAQGGPAASYTYVIGKGAADTYNLKSRMTDLSNEGFIIKTVKNDGKPCIVVSGKDYQGIAYGVLRLARIISASPQKLVDLDMTLNPVLSMRHMYEEHGWGKPQDMRAYKLLLNKYFEEGINAFDLPIGWFTAPSDYLIDPSKAQHEDFPTVHQVIKYAHSLGIKVFITEDAYLNPLFTTPKTNLKKVDPDHLDEFESINANGKCEPLLLCLNNPISRDLLRKNREVLYKEFTDADGATIYFGDPGGCWHKECQPHGKMIVDILNDVYTPLIKETNPDLKIVLTLWGIGFEDTEYVIKNISKLPANVIAMQIPPTNMRHGEYLEFEPARGELIRQASQNMPVIIQQFYEGIGFRNGWVDVWEHPMPKEMSDNFQKSYAPGTKIVGAYGSSFELCHQLVDTRIGMEWAWYPEKSAADILAEFGDEQFGTGVGSAFSRAMYAMDDYWYQEVRRFHFDGGPLADHDLAQLKKSLENAQTALQNLMSAEGKVNRNRLYYKGFTDLAELMVLTARMNITREYAKRASEDNKTSDAVRWAESALNLSTQIVDIIRDSDRYSWIVNTPWWPSWDIGKRPESLQRLVNDVKHPITWKPMKLDDPSFESKAWENSGEELMTFVDEAHTGTVAAKMVINNSDRWSEMHPVQSLNVKPDTKYRVQFWAKVEKGTPRLYIDWSGGISDGENCEVSFAPGNGWNRYTVDVITPKFKSDEKMILRFIAYATNQEILIDDVSLFQPEK